MLQLPVVGRRGHDQGYRNGDQDDGEKMKTLLVWLQSFPKSLIEDCNQLKAEQGLNARQHHPAFFEKMTHNIGERFLWLLFLVISHGGGFHSGAIEDLPHSRRN